MEKSVFCTHVPGRRRSCRDWEVLFDIETQARALSHADRLLVRQKQSKPVLDTLHARLLSWQTKLLPKHPVVQAVGYLKRKRTA